MEIAPTPVPPQTLKARVVCRLCGEERLAVLGQKGAGEDAVWAGMTPPPQPYFHYKTHKEQ